MSILRLFRALWAGLEAAVASVSYTLTSFPAPFWFHSPDPPSRRRKPRPERRSARPVGRGWDINRSNGALRGPFVSSGGETTSFAAGTAPDSAGRVGCRLQEANLRAEGSWI
ncbi:hypothetical protein BC834DRAFT_638137 [Gloeopeniophorella convolvens]|nr:hypothetical protein BC834DRAFT_638137 [Gloeopeniophorella convolvens]